MAPLSLSPAQVAQYKRDGFLALRANEHGLVKPEELKAWATQVHDWPLEKGKWMPYLERSTQGKKQLLRTENFVDYHPQFHNLLCGDELAHVLKQISGDDMLLFKDKINYKHAHGNGFQAHLDAPAYDHIGEIEHLTANFAVDAATLENGCLEVVPGSQKMDVSFKEGGHISPEWEDSHEWVPVKLEAGDLLLFGSHLAHRSGPNNTEESRAAVYATFHAKADGDDLRTKYYAHRRVMFPPDHERVEGENYEAGWKRYGFAAPFIKESPSSTVAV